MSDIEQYETGEEAVTDSRGPHGVKLRTYAVVPTTARAPTSDPYYLRITSDQAQPEAETEPQEPRSIPFASLVLAAAAIACVVALFFTIPMLLRSKQPAHFVDLGNRRFEPAGLGGRLIARWEGSATYQLTIDPLEPQELDGFRAVVSDPPHPLSLVIRLRDAAGLIACQREILLPAPQRVEETGHARVLLSGTTPAGDSVQYVAGVDGKLAEIALEGPLSCPANVYRSFAGWDFTSNFPALAGRDEWLRHEHAVEEARRPHHDGGEWGAAVRHLSAPVEGDDVIIGDNPSRGTVDTSAGRVFLVMKNRAAEWQIFPSAIHFRCDKNGACVLSRANARTTLQARLLK